jgi:hypothetical protein
MLFNKTSGIRMSTLPLKHPFLAKSNTFEIWLFGMDISIPGSKTVFKLNDFLLIGQPSCGIIKTTAD